MQANKNIQDHIPLVLSTKILGDLHLKQLEQEGLQLKAYDAITVEEWPFLRPQNLKNAIFTSQNALKAYINHLAVKTVGNHKTPKVFCVGHKTAALAAQNGLMVVVKANNAAALAAVIIEKYPLEEFCFFCGDRRREELPRQLYANAVRLKEVVVYRTHLQPKKLTATFDAVLFF